MYSTPSTLSNAGKIKDGEMSILDILAKCPLAKCPLAECPGFDDDNEMSVSLVEKARSSQGRVQDV